ncbi:hypothetical protein SprV_0702345700 [Sparganum proliferum]
MVKAARVEAILLTHPAPDASISLMLTPPVGAVLHHHHAVQKQPRSFHLQKVITRRIVPRTFGLEFLTAKHCQQFLDDGNLRVFPENKPLAFTFKLSSDEPEPRKIRQLDFISQFTSDIHYIDGSRKEVADALFRPSTAHLQFSLLIDLADGY